VKGHCVREVDGLAALANLTVEQPTGHDEGAEVGDGVVDTKATPPPLDGHGLVEILRTGWIDGDERQVGRVETVGVTPGVAARSASREPPSAKSDGSANSSRPARKPIRSLFVRTTTRAPYRALVVVPFTLGLVPCLAASLAISNARDAVSLSGYGPSRSRDRQTLPCSTVLCLVQKYQPGSGLLSAMESA